MSHNKLRTVLGDVDPMTMGRTLTHEHLFISGDGGWEPSVPQANPSPDAAPTVDTLWAWREGLDAHRSNLRLDNEEVATAEVSLLRGQGFNTVLDLTSIGLGPRPDALKRVARRTGLNIVAGTGFYTAGTLSEDDVALTVEQMVDVMVRDITEGIAGTEVKAGVIGEVGISWPIRPVEERSLAASIEASRRTGAAVSIHTPFFQKDVGILEAISRRLESLDADMDRVILGHCDTYTTEPRFFEVAAELGPILQIDMFGNSGYEIGFDFWYPSDEQRLEAVVRLAEAGLAQRLMLSQDCGLKTCLRAYGGHGYDYIPRVIGPRLDRLVGKTVTEQLLATNAQRIFPLSHPVA